MWSKKYCTLWVKIHPQLGNFRKMGLECYIRPRKKYFVSQVNRPTHGKNPRLKRQKFDLYWVHMFLFLRESLGGNFNYSPHFKLPSIVEHLE